MTGSSPHRTPCAPLLPEMPLSLQVFALAGAVAFVSTALAVHIGPRMRALVDTPRARHHHRKPMPRIGGVALFAGFAAASALAYTSAPLSNPADERRIVGVLIGCAFLFFIGLLDDWCELGWLPQLLAQLGAAVIAIGATVFIERFTNPFSGDVVELHLWPFVGPVLVFILTCFWIVGMMNTVNWLDGLDGLAAGVGAIAAILFAVHMISLAQQQVSLYALALAGACLGVLPFNFNPARIFLGGTGAMVLGYALATLSILAPARLATALLVMAVPITDTAWQIFHRYRRGASILHGDRGHLHFRLIDLGHSQRRIVIGYWVAAAAFGALSLTVSSQLIKLAALILLMTVTIFYLSRLSRQDSLS